VKQVLEVLDHIKRAAVDEAGLPSSWAAAMAVADRIEVQLRSEGADTREVRALAAKGEALEVRLQMAVSDAPTGEARCVTALGLWFGALKWYGRGVFDQAMANLLDRADALVSASRPRD
jgi:hypothetical protein